MDRAVQVSTTGGDAAGIGTAGISTAGPGVVGLDAVGISGTGIDEVGGKGANLGELSRIEGIRVPDGFCVTAEAYRRVVAGSPSFAGALDGLTDLTPADREAIGAASAEIRRVVEAIPLPDDLVTAVGGALSRLGAHTACAVRSSATAEDLPGTSFAGQHDSYLGVVGPAAVLEHVRRCWASLFTERAVTYRLRHGVDHRRVDMAVVVQAMVAAEAAGVLFTADPVTSNRKAATVDAVRGLGDALVSGTVNPDTCTVRDDAVVTRAGHDRPVLTDDQALRLVRLGRRIEAHFGRPQDIEWCLAGDEFHIVQSRPITTLFPVPEADDGENHVYVSVGHQQMMTDAMRPLGLSVWQRTTPRSMAEAGGRLFVDVAAALAAPESRASILVGLGESDPLMGDALQTVLDREGFLPVPADPGPAGAPKVAGEAGPGDPIEADPALVAELVEDTRASVAALERDLHARSGPELVEFVLADFAELRRTLFTPRSGQVIRAGMAAASWLNSHVLEWLGERNVADTLSQSVPHNVTSEMGLALLDVADAMRPYPDVVAFLAGVEHPEEPDDPDHGFLDELGAVADGGPVARDALVAFLDRYGVRCAGEIDITRPRWNERPALLASTLLGYLHNHEPGAAERLFEDGRRQAREKEQDLLRRIRELPDGQCRADETEQMIDRVRAFAGYREYPKFGMIQRYALYKEALLREAGRLVDSGVLRAAEDVFYLRLEEFAEVVRTNRVDEGLIRTRRAEFRSFQDLTPPRVITSDGEVPAGAYHRDDVPAGALAGLAVSAGTVEGRARVVLDMARADLAAGDILVTTSTDPGWTPLFVGIAGLVTEVGGLMTHGAVIAREYGLPAVVGVENATRLVQDGQRIRVHGTEGYVEVLGPYPRG
ncbi:pyruvate, water dikinase [Pseudonocardia ammonioxydans]|uniref:Rifampicin phosphotransferase n=1 Tax=Pseudonocardia ammonioxydans TaxID=260086 RepID=A0A1I5BBB0_PSUAM|nr:pyruvate, water dikinase [Pseudonocardia ammonioxydans]